jgi:hypothetical protein
MEFARADYFLITNFAKPYAEIPWSDLPGFTTDMPVYSSILKGNPIGDILCQMLEPLDSGFVQRKCREDVNVNATQLLLALKVYQMQHGKLPESLSELVPEFFPQVPLDDFDGKPFRYSLEKKIIYSVGPCLKDLGGKKKVGNSLDYNLPFPIDF